MKDLHLTLLHYNIGNKLAIRPICTLDLAMSWQ